MTTLQIQCTHIQYMYLHGSNNRRVTSRYTRRFSCFVVRLTSSSTMRWNGWGYDDTKLFLSRRYCAHHSHCAFDRHRRLERYCWKLSGYGIVEGRSTEIEHRPFCTKLVTEYTDFSTDYCRRSMVIRHRNDWQFAAIFEYGD